MDNLIAVKTNDEGKVDLTLDELNELLDKAYSKGYEAGKASNPTITPYIPYTPPATPWTPTPTYPTTPWTPFWWDKPYCVSDRTYPKYSNDTTALGVKPNIGNGTADNIK